MYIYILLFITTVDIINVRNVIFLLLLIIFIISRLV